MQRRNVAVMAVLAGLGLAIVPALLPTGPTTSLDAAGFLAEGRFAVAAGVIFLGGLLTALTPCVYPLIPITVGVFGARQADSRGRAFVLTSAYVVGMGLVFAILGVVAALSGKAFGSALGNRYIVMALAVFLLVLASSMFGAFELALPTELAVKLNGVGGGGVVGALLMGSVAGFLAAPCTGPVLTGVLAWVSQTQDPIVGGALLFIYAMGIGVPFFLIGVFTVRLPKSGVWMEWVKSIFGIALVALAASYVRDAFPGFGEALSSAGSALGLQLGIAVAAGLAVVGVVLGAVHLSFKEGRQWLPKGLGVALLTVAILMRTAAKDAPLSDSPNGGGDFAWSLVFQPTVDTSGSSFEQALKKASADCKPVLIDFFADWCAACKELDEHTYTAGEVKTEAERFVRVKVDGTEDTDVLTEIYGRFEVKGLPTVAFIDPKGKVLTSPRVTGFMEPQAFATELRKVALADCSPAP